MKLHSMVDIITNSSSTTYVFSDGDSIVKMKEFINEVIKITGAEGNVEDYFDIGLVSFSEAEDQVMNPLYARIAINPKNNKNKDLYELAASVIVVWDNYSSDCVKNGRRQGMTVIDPDITGCDTG